MHEKSPARHIALMGIMLGMVMVLTTLEHVLVVPFLPPHVKPGFANIMVMYCVFVLGGRQAFMLNVLKAVFVLATRGFIAGLLSLSGGMVSVGVIILLAGAKGGRMGYAAVSVGGALAHNLGQLAVIMLLFASGAMVYYLPVLIISGMAAGLLTGALLKALMPVLVKLHKGQWGGHG
ncbi:MAG: Gx transporter family protein [Defluviitaleaceae bacterium]|nr:Gx transporter family protein [Defluviitaleaceae bacterium]MCL2239687.1 Gx transporter family protein [Defluviitaleaceae bacterium]